MRELIHFAISVMLVLSISGQVFGQTAKVQLEKGVYQEETIGDLQAAIKIYVELIEEAKANRPAVAEAHYRLGQCFLKLGENKKAEEFFLQVVTQFPEQVKFVKLTKQALNERVQRPKGFLPLGQVVERMIYDDEKENKDIAIDLDTGQLFTPDWGLVEAFKNADQSEAYLCKEGIDAWAEPIAPDVQGLMGFDLVRIPLAADQWEIGDTDLRKLLTKAPWPERGRRDKSGLSTKSRFPVTFGFRTREGSEGVLQITKVHKEPKPAFVEIVYKLLSYGTPLPAVALNQLLVAKPEGVELNSLIMRPATGDAPEALMIQGTSALEDGAAVFTENLKQQSYYSKVKLNAIKASSKGFIFQINAPLNVATKANDGEAPEHLVRMLTDLKSMEKAIEMFALDVGRYPTQQEGLKALVAKNGGEGMEYWKGPYIRTESGKFLDPWGNPYQYVFPGAHNQKSFDLFSLGADGVKSDDDIGNWDK
jgi:general secretion pathway protein G